MNLLAVAGWSVAEAILWFFVADVPISFVALRWGWRKGVAAAFVAALAASAGGAVTYQWAAADPAGAERTILALPAIDRAQADAARASLAAQGDMAMLKGSLSGTPYKLYAMAAGRDGRPFIPFLLATPLVRLPRFLLAALGTAAISALLGRRLSLRARCLILAGFWLFFYGWYFAVMPG
jgi:membrane protein YqaA with SNARE-associated domain